MKVLLWAERQKLKRSKIVWIATFATIMVTIIVFAQGQFSYGGVSYIDSAEWFLTAVQSLGTFFVLPAIIALLGGYMICREEEEDTLKSLAIIPINEMRLTIAKMIIALIFSIAIYLVLFIIALSAEALLHFESLALTTVYKFFNMYLLTGIGVFLAVSPIIALVALVKKGYWLALIFAEIYSFLGLFIGSIGKLGAAYPIIAVFNISGYYEATTIEITISVITLLLCGIIAGGILTTKSRKKN